MQSALAPFTNSTIKYFGVPHEFVFRKVLTKAVMTYRVFFTTSTSTNIFLPEPADYLSKINKPSPVEITIPPLAFVGGEAEFTKCLLADPELQKISSRAQIAIDMKALASEFADMQKLSIVRDSEEELEMNGPVPLQKEMPKASLSLSRSSQRVQDEKTLNDASSKDRGFIMWITGDMDFERTFCPAPIEYIWIPPKVKNNESETDDEDDSREESGPVNAQQIAHENIPGKQKKSKTQKRESKIMNHVRTQRSRMIAGTFYISEIHKHTPPCKPLNFVGAKEISATARYLLSKLTQKQIPMNKGQEFSDLTFESKGCLHKEMIFLQSVNTAQKVYCRSQEFATAAPKWTPFFKFKDTGIVNDGEDNITAAEIKLQVITIKTAIIIIASIIQKLVVSLKFLFLCFFLIRQRWTKRRSKIAMRK